MNGFPLNDSDLKLDMINGLLRTKCEKFNRRAILSNKFVAGFIKQVFIIYTNIDNLPEKVNPCLSQNVVNLLSP